MMKEQYNQMYENLHPEEELIENTIHAASEVKPSRPVIKYTVAAAACAALAVGSVPVLAANVPAFYELLHKIAPETAEQFKPVQTSCVDQGIRMEVGAIYVNENDVKIYLTLQDLESDRLNMDLEKVYKQYTFETPGFDSYGWSGGLDFVEYDPETKTLTTLIEIETNKKYFMAGKEMAFHLDSVLGDRIEYDGMMDNVNLAEIPLSSTIWTDDALFNAGYSTSGSKAAMTVTEDMWKMLEPSMEIELPMESVAITAIGYIDGQLHIQLRCSDLDMQTAGNLHLIKENGSEVSGELVYYGEVTTDNGKYHYSDFIFDVSEEELRECELSGYLTKYTAGVQGNWDVTFTIPEEEMAEFE